VRVGAHLSIYIYIHKGRMSISDWPIAPLIISEASRTPIGRAERGEPNRELAPPEWCARVTCGDVEQSA